MDGHPAGNIFFALVPPSDVVGPLREAVARLRPQVDRVAWVDPRRWHVTAAFLGRVDPRPVMELPVQLPARPRLTLAGTGTFGDRVLWAGVTGPLDEVVRAVGADPDGFTGHLTIGRTRGRRAWRGLREVAARLTYQEMPWLPDRLVLMRSIPGQAYEELATWSWS